MTPPISSVSIRRWLKKLLDRNLLQGNINEGVCMHDIVRDLMRERIGDEDAIGERQRTVVEAFARICPADGWLTGDSVGRYATLALREHMKDALLPDPLANIDANSSWQIGPGTIQMNERTRAPCAQVHPGGGAHWRSMCSDWRTAKCSANAMKPT